MKTIGILFLSLSLYSFSYAGECIPSMSVEQAQKIYQAGLAKISQELEVRYGQALSAYEKSLVSSSDAFRQRVSEAESRYKAEMQLIQSQLGPKWQEQVDAAVGRYNEAVLLASRDFPNENSEQRRIYEETVRSAANAYRQSVLQLADAYNKSVCAQGTEGLH